MELIWMGIAIGVGATVAMDIWAWILWKTLGVPLPNWAMPGRWVGNLPRFHHADIASAATVRNELQLGWAFHYAVGAAYGLFFAIVAGTSWFEAPTFLPAWIFAILTISAGWFILQPGMGLGWAAAKTPNPWKVRGLGLLAHTVFGLGLYLTALVL